LSTTFVFVVEDVTRLHPALRSRSQAFRLKALAPLEARAALEAVCAREGLVYEQPALKVIVGASGGFVGRSLRGLAAVAQEGEVTLARALRVLGVDWGGTLLACWQALLEGRRAEAEERLESVSRDSAVRLRALQAFGLALYRRVAGMEEIRVHPALDVLRPAEWEPVLAAVGECARRRSLKGDDWAYALMVFWADVHDPRTLPRSFQRFAALFDDVRHGP
jgi:hypothetical protein